MTPWPLWEVALPAAATDRSPAAASEPAHQVGTYLHYYGIPRLACLPLLTSHLTHTSPKPGMRSVCAPAACTSSRPFTVGERLVGTVGQGRNSSCAVALPPFGLFYSSSFFLLRLSPPSQSLPSGLVEPSWPGPRCASPLHPGRPGLHTTSLEDRCHRYVVTLRGAWV